jgi:hypothetical protein
MITYSVKMRPDSLYWKSDFTCIPKDENAQPRSQFLYSCICERFIYSLDQSTYLAAAKLADRSWDYISRSQIHECGNWETEHYNFCFENNEATQIHFLEYINRNQTFVLDSHQPFIYSAEWKKRTSNSLITVVKEATKLTLWLQWKIEAPYSSLMANKY